MSLKSGLLAESTWAIDSLNILFNEQTRNMINMTTFSWFIKYIN